MAQNQDTLLEDQNESKEKIKELALEKQRHLAYLKGEYQRQKRSSQVAYFLFFFGSFLGIHQVYLGNLKRAFLAFSSQFFSLIFFVVAYAKTIQREGIIRMSLNDPELLENPDFATQVALAHNTGTIEGIFWSLFACAGFVGLAVWMSDLGTLQKQVNNINDATQAKLLEGFDAGPSNSTVPPAREERSSHEQSKNEAAIA